MIKESNFKLLWCNQQPLVQTLTLTGALATVSVSGACVDNVCDINAYCSQCRILVKLNK